MLQPNENVSGTVEAQAIFSPSWNQVKLCIMHGKSSRNGA